MRKKVIIIGAGIAGLSNGCYLQMNHYETEIFELHSIPGGLCTSWKRKDYIFDGSIHWLCGTKTDSFLNKMWNELVDMKKLQIVNHDIFMRIEDENGKFIDVFANLDKLHTELLEKAPEDKKIIEEIIHAAKKLTSVKMPADQPMEIASFFEKAAMMAKMLPVMGIFQKFSKITMEEYAENCKNPLLKLTLLSLFEPKMAAIFQFFTLAWMHNQDAGYPIGGSLEFSKKIEKRYCELGGKIHYHSKVSKILVKNEKAYGIELENGEQFFADIIISAADGRNTIFGMLEGKFLDKTIQSYYDEYTIFSPYIQISLGLKRKFDDFPASTMLKLSKNIQLDPKTSLDSLWTVFYYYDPTFAPEGKTSVVILPLTRDFDFWDNLRKNDKEKYSAEKQRIADEIIDALENKYGNFKEHIEVIDVATPSTVYRYTGNYQGSMEGWILSPQNATVSMKKTLPHLANFYMCGQWVQPGGGLPGALISARQVAQIICHDDKIKFTTSHF